MELDLQQVVSRRVEQTLRERDWPHSTLVYEMMKAGVDLDKSAISRSLRSERQWKLQELIPLANALGLTLSDLLTDPQEWADRKARALVDKWGAHLGEAEKYDDLHQKSLSDAEDVFDELRSLIKYDPDTRTAFEAAIYQRALASGRIKTEEGRRRMVSFRLYKLTEDPAHAVGIEDLLPRDEQGNIAPPKRGGRRG